jgi:hypothetical protein
MRTNSLALGFALLLALPILSSAQDAERRARPPEPNLHGPRPAPLHRPAPPPAQVPEPDLRPLSDRYREIEELQIPADRFGTVLEQHPGGVFLRPLELAELLRRAEAWRPQPQIKPELAPASWVLERCETEGSFHAPTRSLVLLSTAQLRLLNPGWQHIPLPQRGLALGAVRIDGRPAELTQHQGQPCLLLEGPGTFSLSLDFAVPVQRRAEGPGGRFSFELLASAAGKLSFALPGHNEIHSDPATAVSRREGEGPAEQTRVEIATGGVTQIDLSYQPAEIQVRKASYVIAHKVTTYTLGQSVALMRAALSLEIQRQPLSRLDLDLPTGFTLRTLSAENSPSWLQEGSRVQINLAEPRLGKLNLTIVAERALKGGALSLEPLSVPTAAREDGLVLLRGDADVKLRILGERGLERRTPPAELSEQLRGSEARLYAEGPQGFTLELESRPVLPRVRLEVTALQELEASELRSRVVYRYRVDEGAIFTLKPSFPAELDLESLNIFSSDQGAVAYDWQDFTLEGRKELRIELERGISAGQVISVVLNLQRALPDGLEKLSEMPLPVFAGAPASRLSGFMGLAVDAGFELRGEVMRGLTAVPAEELVILSGLAHENLALAYRIDEALCAGALRVQRKPQRLSAELLLAHSLADKVVTTQARLRYELRGAPSRSVKILLPAGRGKNALVEGLDVKERRVLEDPKQEGLQPGYEILELTFTKPQSKGFELLLSFDTEIPGFNAEGAAKTSFKAPLVHALGVEREAGIVTVYSSDSTELSAAAEGLTAVEVVSAPRDERFAVLGRPLLAYSYPRAEYELKLELQRFEDGVVLTALAESLDLQSSVGVDGTVRHEARFILKNLSHQFLELALPKGARLWSVSVNGEGIKPAEGLAEGRQVLPLPLKGAQTRDQSLELKLIYDERGQPLSEGQEAKLQAPKLLIPRSGAQSEAVPLVRTSWRLEVPDDSRIVASEGNLENLPGQRDAVLTLRISSWLSHAWTHGKLKKLSLMGLGFAISIYLIFTLMIAPVYRALRASPEVFFASVKVLLLGAAVLAGLAFAFTSLIASRGRTGRGRSDAPQSEAKAIGGSAYPTPVVAEDSANDGGMASIEVDLPSSEEALGDERDGRDHYEARKELNRKMDRADNKPSAPRVRAEPTRPGQTAKMKGPPRQEAQKRPEAPPPPPATAAPMPAPKPAPIGGLVGRHRFSTATSGEDAPAADPAGPGADYGITLKKLKEGEKGRADEVGAAEPEENEKSLEGYDDAKSISGKTLDSDAYARLTKGEAERAAKAMELSRLSGEDSAQGLRSLTFSLPQLGERHEMRRLGGEAWLRVRLLNESSYRSLGLLAVVLGFLASLVLAPRMKRFNILGWTVLGLGLATAFALTSSSAAMLASANGFAAGLLAAAPVHLVIKSFADFWSKREQQAPTRPSIRVLV